MAVEYRPYIPFAERLSTYRAQSKEIGLAYGVSRLFGMIPSGIGHIVDTLLGLNGKLDSTKSDPNEERLRLWRQHR